MTTLPASFVVVSGLKPESLKFSSCVTLRITKTFNQRKPGCKHRFNCRTRVRTKMEICKQISYMYTMRTTPLF